MVEYGDRIYLWGTGYIAEYINQKYGSELKLLNIVGYIDNNIQKVGCTYKEKEVYSPDILKKEKDCKVIILIKNYEEVKEQIQREYPWLIENVEDSYFFEKIGLLKRYQDSEDSEIHKITNRLKEAPLRVFNYDFADKYSEDEINVYFDEKLSLYYVFHEKKKMYFSKQYTNEKAVKEYYQSLIIEQDEDSPHRYLTDSFYVKEGDVVVDGGVAEGNFALSVVENVKKIYLFEPDIEWCEALSHTFEAYKDKVVIVNKAISNFSNGDTQKLDDIIHEKINFIKLDIEGEELYALEGANEIIQKSNDLSCAVCTYHQEFAYDAIYNFLKNRGFTIEHSKGYMWYPENSCFRMPVLRRGLLRAYKDE